MDRIQTVRGYIDAVELGHCQPHEHVYIVETVALYDQPQLRISNLPASMKELERYKAAGGCSVVDVQPIATGRDPLALLDASCVTGVNIVASTGYHIPFFYEKSHWIYTEEEATLTAVFVKEIQKGMYFGGCYSKPRYQSDIKAGAVKAAVFKGFMGGRYELLLRAAAKAAKEAGAPLILHTEAGEDALEALKVIEKTGLDASRVLVCHLDRQTERRSLHTEVADTGAYLEYDTIDMFGIHNDVQEVDLILYMLEKGYENQILIATDPTKDRLIEYGGSVGMDFILKSFIPQLRYCGVSEDTIRKMSMNNPAKALLLEN